MTVATAPKDDFIPAAVRAVAPYFLLVLAVLIVYGNIYDNVFLFDDDLLIQLDTYLRGWGHIGDILRGSTTSGATIAGGFYRPVQILLYLIVFQLGGGTTFLFHLLNLALHAGNSCFMYRLGTKLKFRPGGVFFATLIWTLHPLHTEAVTYMSATADPLFAFFCLWAVVVLVPNVTPRKIFKIIPLFLLGLFSKETTVMFPLLVMSCLFLTDPARLNIRTYLRTWPLWIITLIYVAWRMQAPGFDGPQTYARLYLLHDFATLKMYADHPIYRIYTFLATLPAYLVLLLHPVGLHMERAFSIYTVALCAPVLTGLGMFTLALAQIVRSARNPKHGIELGWGLLWFGAAHAPDAGILVPMNALFLEHWMYLPTVGLFLGIAETLAKFLQGRSRIWAGGCCIAAIAFAAMLATRTYAQNAVWHDPVSFYNNIFAHGERSARARNNLALYYSDHGDFPAAIEQFKQAIAISDTYAETRHNLALTYLRMDQYGHAQDAIENLNRALELDPNFYRSYRTLGDLYEILGDPAKAKYYHDRATALTAPRR